MKRRICFLMMLLLLFTAFCGCNSSKPTSDTLEDKVVTSTVTTVTGGETSSAPKKNPTVSVDPVFEPINSKPKEVLKVVPEPKNPYLKRVENYGGLDEETALKFKTLYSETRYSGFIDRLLMTDYYGTFSDGSIALRFEQSDTGIDRKNRYKLLGKYYCIFFSKVPVVIYKNDKFYNMDEAYSQGVIDDNMLDEFFDKNPKLDGTEYCNYRIRARRQEIEEWMKTPTEKEERSYWKGSVDENFKEGDIIICLTLEATKENFLRKYTPKDFPELECASIKELTNGTWELMVGEIRMDESDRSLEELNVSKFNRMFTITLKEKTKQAVCDGIRALDNRKDILHAEPNYIFTMDF